MKARAAVALAVALTASAPEAGAQELSAALAYESEGRLGEALDAFEATLERPGNSRDDLATIYLHLSVLRLATGDRDAARIAMHRLLALDPDPTLPGSAPPEAQSLLDEVSTVWAGRRLRCDVSAPERVGPGEDLRVELHVVDDVAGLVAGAALMSGPTVAAEGEGRGAVTLTVPASGLEPGSNTLSPRLLDRHGGTVWEGAGFEVVVEAPAAGAPAVPPEPTADEPEPGRDPVAPPAGLRIAGWSLLAVGVVAAAGGAVLLGIDGMETGQTRGEGGSAEEEYLTTGTGGWIALGLGVAAIAAGIVLLVVRPGAGGSEATALRVGRGLVASW